jgi:anti-anti-sigma regulatory factor
MPVSIEKTDEMFLISLDGVVAIPTAAELKAAILQGLASGQDLCFDLQNATELDITALQLLWAAGREASIAGMRAVLSGQVPETILTAAADAGFETFPLVAK